MKPFKKKKHIDSHSEVQKVLKGDWQKVFYVFYGQDPTKVSCLRRKEQQRHFSTLNLSVFNENILHYITQQPHTDYTFLT